MRVMLLVSAAAALSAMTIAPAAADTMSGSGSGWHHGGSDHHGHHGSRHHRNSWARVDFRRFEIPDNLRVAHSRDRHGFGSGGYGSGYGDYGYGNVDDSAFRSDGYNDWWHDRPDRAYPRWVQAQRGAEACDADRMWWHGSVLSC